MPLVNAVLNTVCDLLMSPFRGASPWPGMLAIACLTAVLFVWTFRVLSNQRAIKRKKGRLLARALELHVYRHDLIVSLTAFPRILQANGAYLREMLKPVAVAIVPTVLLLIQLACWFEHRPFTVGEPVLLSVDFTDGFSVIGSDVALMSSTDLDVETDGLRVPALRQVNWRLRARKEGTAWVEVRAGDTSLRKDIIVSSRLLKVSDRRVRSGFWNELLHPVEPSIPSESAAEQIRVSYPRRQLMVAGIDVNWLVAYLVLTMACGLLVGRLLKVSF